MKLTQGVSYLAIPGPSVMPMQVLRAMQRPSPNIYAGALVDLTHALVPRLRAVARTAHDVAIYIGNGHAAWEAALSNVLVAGDKVLVLSTGQFAHSWADMAEGLGIEAEILEFGQTDPVDPARLEARLRADSQGEIKAVLAVHTDTATGLRSEIAPLRAALSASGHPALLMVDCIASLACDPFEMDLWDADVMISACQKGLMTPAGLSFNWIGPRAMARREAMDRVSRYWDWLPRCRPEYLYNFFDGTAPTHHLYALNEALGMIDAEGLEAIWARHAALARAVWGAVEHWGQEGAMRLNVADPAARSHAVTSIHLPGGDAARLQDWCRDYAGLTLGIGLGRSPAEDYFRVGHMGHVNAQMILGALATIEAGLIALDIPHAAGGVRRAAELLGRS